MIQKRVLEPGLLYFAYGCNMDHAFLESVLGRQISPGWAARVDGWRLAFNKGGEGEAGGGVVANLVSAEEGTTYGVVYRLPFESLAALDEFEGAPEHYRRDTLFVEPVGRQALQAAVTYLGQPRWIVSEGKPPEDYLDLVVRGAATHGIPGDYIDWLRLLANLEAVGCYRVGL